MWHTLIHWLDDARREGVSTFAWEAVKTNLGASGWLFAGVTLTWPKLRKLLWLEMKKAEAEVGGIEGEIKTLERDLLKPVKWLLSQGKKVGRVRVTVKKPQSPPPAQPPATL